MLNGDRSKVLGIAINFEGKCLMESPNREAYMERWGHKMKEIQEKRALSVQSMQPGQMNMNNGNNMGMMQN